MMPRNMHTRNIHTRNIPHTPKHTPKHTRETYPDPNTCRTPTHKTQTHMAFMEQLCLSPGMCAVQSSAERHPNSHCIGPRSVAPRLGRGILRGLVLRRSGTWLQLENGLPCQKHLLNSRPQKPMPRQSAIFPCAALGSRFGSQVFWVVFCFFWYVFGFTVEG